MNEEIKSKIEIQTSWEQNESAKNQIRIQINKLSCMDEFYNADRIYNHYNVTIKGHYLTL